MSARFSAAIVRARWFVVVGWIAIAVALTVLLPSVGESQGKALGALVPAGAEALEAEKRSAELFAFPLSSRVLIVERDADGLDVARLGATARLALDVTRGQVEELDDVAAAFVLPNTVRLPFARERNTTLISYLLFGLDVGQGRSIRRAEAYEDRLRDGGGGEIGITGAIPARAEQSDAIADRLPVVELATVAFIALAVAFYLRSLVAPLVNLATVVIAYLVSVRMAAVAGEVADVSVPAEIEPVLVALLFGIVTDYGLFYMTRYRRRLADGDAPALAARGTAAEITPVVVACGLAVAAGSAALGVAELGFLRAFGPGMALAVLVGLVVAVTFLPAALALIGPRVFLPSHPHQASRGTGDKTRTERLLRHVVRRPIVAIAASLVVLGGMASGVAWLELGNPLIRGLPAGSEPREVYAEVSEGFAPGVVAPTSLIVEGEGIAEQRDALEGLQAVLSAQPGIAGVVGPATVPEGRSFGVTTARSGDAARFVLIPETDPLGADAIRRLANLRERIDDIAEAVGLDASRTSFAGDTALAEETIALAEDDLLRVGLVVLAAVALVLAIFLRSLVAPLYLVLLAALSPLAALGLAVALFQGILGHPELTYFVPIIAGVLLVSLGSDYNVFLAGRIWGEAQRRPLHEAIVAGGAGAAHAISAAGVVLAASFAALALVPLQTFQELSFVLAAGLLIDAFIVRTVLAPAVIALVGDLSRWPRKV